jgi:glutamate dehydrogenase (NAD(P)+)
MRLARAMTYKNAAAGLAHGGAKAVLRGDPKMPRPQKELRVRALARSLRHLEEYIFAPDMGTDEQCMSWVLDEIGRVVALPRELGGIPLDEIGATGWGLRHVAEVACEHIGLELSGARFAVQGFGAVGKHAARFLSQRGAVLVAAADSAGTVHDPRGLDVDALIALKEAGRPLRDHPAGEQLAPGAVLDIECEIWIPAARPDVITAQNAQRVKARLILEGANIPVTPEAERSLHERGVLCVPDFIANAGGVICAAMEYRGASERAAFEAIEEKLRRNTEEVLQRAAREQILPRVAAVDLAVSRVRAAMAARRFSLLYGSP